MDYEEGRERFEQEHSWLQRRNDEGRATSNRRRGKYHVSERIDLLLDPGTWFEYGKFARSTEPGARNRSQRDGTMTGFGKVNGRTVAIIGDDITAMGGTQSLTNVRKVERVLTIAFQNNFPIISLSEGGGLRVPDCLGAGFTRLIGEHHPILSLTGLAHKAGRPLLICGVFGYCYGDPALRASSADITIMLKDSAVALSGPPLLEAAISEKITDIELGGPELHKTVTGVVDRVVDTEDECIKMIRDVFHLLRPPEECSDPVDRQLSSIESIVPHDNRKVYDMRRVVEQICDNGEWLEFKSWFGKGVLVGLARIGGQLVGIVANQPLSAGGSVDAKGLKKAGEFLDFAVLRRVPLLVLQDVPGFLIGSYVEKDGMVKEVSNYSEMLDRVDVPMVSIIIRKAYGVAYYFLGATSSGAQFVAAWPNTEISFTAPEMGAAILTKHAKPEEKQDALKRVAEDIRTSASVWDSAYEAWIDSIILPEDTRKIICQAFSILGEKAPGPFG